MLSFSVERVFSVDQIEKFCIPVWGSYVCGCVGFMFQRVWKCDVFFERRTKSVTSEARSWVWAVVLRDLCVGKLRTIFLRFQFLMESGEWGVTPYSLSQFYRRFWGTSVNFNQNTQRHIHDYEFATTVSWLESQPLPSESFPSHHLAVVVPFDT